MIFKKIICMVLSCLLIGCTNRPSVSSEQTSDVPQSKEITTIKLTMFPGDDDDIQTYMEFQKDKCKSIGLNEKGNAMIIELTPKQKEKWIEESKSYISETLDSITPKDGYTAEVSEDYTVLTIYGTKYWDFDSLVPNLAMFMLNMELLQLLDGADAWHAEFIIKSQKTGETLYEVKNYPYEGINFGGELFDGE